VDELTEQLQSRMEQQEEAQREADRLQQALKERDRDLRDLKATNEQLDLDLQEKAQQVETLKQVSHVWGLCSVPVFEKGNWIIYGF